jgi:hypothetical protein
MIFIGLFLFIVLVVVSLNIHNHSNLDKIEEYLSKSNCKEVIYSRGSYKGLCDNSLIEIKNSFTVDIDKNSNIFNYGEIKNLKIENLELVINDNYKMEFSDKKDLDKFHKELEEKLKN